MRSVRMLNLKKNESGNTIIHSRERGRNRAVEIFPVDLLRLSPRDRGEDAAPWHFEILFSFVSSFIYREWPRLCQNRRHVALLGRLIRTRSIRALSNCIGDTKFRSRLCLPMENCSCQWRLFGGREGGLPRRMAGFLGRPIPDGKSHDRQIFFDNIIVLFDVDFSMLFHVALAISSRANFTISSLVNYFNLLSHQFYNFTTPCQFYNSTKIEEKLQQQKN